jgi:predicted nucleotidyltransferase
VNQQSPTRFPELNRVLSELVEHARALLGESFIGAYLQGSFALGDGDQYSDVDFTVVTREDIAEADVARFNAMHEALHARPETWAQHLEGSYMPAAELRRLSKSRSDPRGATRSPNWTDPQTGQPPHAYPFLYLNNGDHWLLRSEHDNTQVVRWILREHGITLAGPPPSTLIDPVAPDELRAEVYAMMRWFGNDLLHGTFVLNALWRQGFTVLVYCRMLQSLTTGTVVSKPASVAWARANLQSRWMPLIERAWSQRACYPRGRGAPAAHRALLPDPEEVAQTLEFVRFAIEYADEIWSPPEPHG